MIRIVDNKKVDMTHDEYALYEKIVRAYTSETNKGEDFFYDLFESDDNGIIVFLKPPSTRRTSFEIFMFLMAIQQQQYLRELKKEQDRQLAILRQEILSLKSQG